MRIAKILAEDRLFSWGLLLLGASFLIFCIPDLFPDHSIEPLGLFFLNFGCAVAYLILLLFNRRLRKGREGLLPLFVFLLLALISAYSLNRSMNVFEDSVTWFSVLLIICALNYLAFAYYDHCPSWLKYLMSFILGTSVVVFVYLSVYLIPLYIISAILVIALGISLHAFVPLLLVIYTIALARRKRLYRIGFWAGVITPVACMVLFTAYWCTLMTRINRDYRRASITYNNGLPAWVVVTRDIPGNWVSERILKTNLVYSAVSPSHNFFWDMPSRSFEEKKKHDPLVMTASLFSGPLMLSEDDQVKILQAVYDSRHQAQERLASDDDLRTEDVDTRVKIWPDQRLSYTEIYTTVSNFKQTEGWWRDGEEGLYTFHLPEGGTVTSLSLWIGGKEVKGVLTSKEKADSAYRATVTHQADPSVVHWQEGNMVVVRVYPVNRGQSRLFKIGVTAPLKCTGNNMVYEPAYFDGPDAGQADGTIQVDFASQPVGVVVPASFDKTGETHFEKRGAYNTAWSIQMGSTHGDQPGYGFEGKTYKIVPLEKHRGALPLSDVYLDINANWTMDECDEVYNLVKDKPVWVYLGGDSLERVDPSRKDGLFNKLRQVHVSLFPFNLVRSDSSALVVTKSGEASPSLEDLEGTEFFKHIASHFEQSGKVCVFSLGESLSPFLQTLKEFRTFRFEQGDEKDLAQRLKEGTFADGEENDDRVDLDLAGVSIVRSDTSVTAPSAAAPDHLVRLFAYNDVLRKSGMALFNGPLLRPDILEEAKKAYVVSPVSGLIVLETQADYDHFKIDTGGDGLKNASMQGKGAVPEPGEWALIILVALVLAFISYQPARKYR